MKEYIVYKHTNKIDGKVYIGTTSQKPCRRWKRGQGYKPKTAGTTSYIYDAILKYGWDNFSHDILFTGLTKEEAAQKEIELIAEYKSNQREYGHNIDKGGFSAGRMSKETIQKLKNVHKDKEANAERYHKISESRKGMKFSDEHRQHMSQANMGKRVGKDNPTARAVNQYSLNMEYIKMWDCLADAERQLGVCKANICRAIKNDKTAGGFRWKYVKDKIS